MTRCRTPAGLIVMAILLSGCGTENLLGRVPVRGKVTLDGVPLDFGSVTFSPRTGEGTSSGAIIANGEYSIPASKGLPPGEYVVRINAPNSSGQPDPAEAAAGPSGPAVERIAPAYNVHTRLIATVAANQEAVCDFQTTSR